MKTLTKRIVATLVSFGFVSMYLHFVLRIGVTQDGESEQGFFPTTDYHDQGQLGDQDLDAGSQRQAKGAKQTSDSNSQNDQLQKTARKGYGILPISHEATGSTTKEKTNHTSSSVSQRNSENKSLSVDPSLTDQLFHSDLAQGWFETSLRKRLVVMDSFTPQEKENVTYLKTDLKHPWIRVESHRTKIDGEFVEQWKAGAASHLILRKRADVSVQELRKALSEVSIQLISELSVPDIFLVGIEIQEGQDSLAEAVSRLSSLDDIVSSVEIDSVLSSTNRPETQPSLLAGEQWPLHNTGIKGGLPGSDIDAIQGWSIRSDASEVVVAVIDTGIDYQHEDLVSNMWVNVDEIPDNGLDDDGNGYIDDRYGIDTVHHDTDPADDHGHGTHCAGIIGADGLNEFGMTGVAPQVQLMSLKFLSQTGLGFTSDALEAIQYAKENGAQVLNLSWGSRVYSDALHQLLQQCEDAGVIMVASAGNDYDNIDNRPVYPASYPLSRLLTVASVDDFDALSSFSNYGPQSVEIAAPGTQVTSTWLSSDEGYRTLSGTSMAAPHVVGAVALLLAEYPTDIPDEIIARLLSGSEGVDSLSNRVQQRRRLSLPGALQADPFPENDIETQAIASALHSLVWTGSNRNARTEIGDEARTASIWYEWSPPASGTALIQVEASEGVMFDIISPGSTDPNPLLSHQSSGIHMFNVQKNTPYAVVVYGSVGDFRLQLSVPPINDNRNRARRVNGSRWFRTGSSLGATTEVGEIGVGFGDEHSVWWTWTAPRSGAVRIDTSGSDFDTMLSVFKENPLEGLVVGDHPDIAFVVDVSGSAKNGFEGAYLSDLNQDGLSNTVLDGEIAAVTNLITYLNQSEASDSNTVRVISFQNSATALDLNPEEQGNQPGVLSTSDQNENGRLDVVEALETLRAQGATNYRAALEAAESQFALSQPDATPNLIFFSDGKPTTGASFSEVVQRLRDAGTVIQAFGVGRGASLGALTEIDPEARIFSSEEELVQMISGALAFSDDTAGQLTSEVNLAVEAGKTYLIKISGYGGETGSIRLNGSMYDGLQIEEHPQSASIEVGERHILSATIRGVPPLAYQWFYNDMAIEGATKPTYVLPEASEEETGDYTLMVSNTFDHLTTNVATLTIYRDPPKFIAGPSSQNVVEGASVQLSASATGTPPLSYQWYLDDELIPGAVHPEYTLPFFEQEDSGRYEVVVTNEAGEIRSGPAYLNLADAPFATWRFRNGSGPRIYPEQTVAYEGYFYVLQDNRVVRTRDGLIWQSSSLPIDEDLFNLNGEIEKVIQHDEGLVAEYVEQGKFSYYTSTDGLTWAYLQTPAYSNSLSRYNEHWYLIGYQGSENVLFTSTDLQTWQVVEDVDPYVDVTLVEQGSLWRYRVDSEPEASNWNYSVYDSSGWLTGNAELGYGEGDEATVIPNVSQMTSAYFIQPFLNEPGYGNYTLQGRVKYDTTATVRFGGHVLYQDTDTVSGNPHGEWVPIPDYEDVNLSSSGYLHPFTVEVGKTESDPSLSFDLELTATTWLGLDRPVAGDDRILVMKRNGDVYISLDGTTWTEHATQGILDPEATGASYLPFDDEPAFLLGKFVGWDKGSDQIYLSDDGITWESHPWPEVEVPIFSFTTTRAVPFDSPEDMIEVDGTLQIHLSVFSYSNILSSTDLLNWEAQYLAEEPGVGDPALMSSLSWGNGYYFAQMGTAGFQVRRSVEDFQTPESPESLDVSRLRVLDGNLVTFPSSYSDVAKISSDGENWARFRTGSKDAVYAEGIYTTFSRGFDSTIWILKSTMITGNYENDWGTGSEMNRTAWPFTWEPWTLRFHAGYYIAAGERGGIATSLDAETWTLQRQASDLLGTIVHADVENGVWLGLTDQGTVITSESSQTFTETALSTSPVAGVRYGGTGSIAYGSGVYLVCVENNDEMEMYRSVNLVDWTRIQPGGNGNPSGVAFGDGWFVAVDDSQIYLSQNGLHWQTGSLPGGGGRFVIHHLNSFWICDENGVFWNTEMGSFPTLPVMEIEILEDSYVYNSLVRMKVEVTEGSSSVTRLVILVDGQVVFDQEHEPFQWETADLSPGSHEIVFKAYDEFGRPSTIRRNVQTAFSEATNVMPGALQHPDGFIQLKDGTFFGLGKRTTGSVNRGAYLARSIDGVLWKEVPPNPGIDNMREFTQLIQLDSGLMLGGDHGEELLLSEDGLNWQSVEGVDLTGVLVTNGERAFMITRVQNGMGVKSSSDGRTWQQETLTCTGGGSGGYDWNIASIVHWNERLIMLGTQRGATAVSSDGIHWTADRPFPTFGLWPRLVAGQNHVVSFSSILGTGSYPDWETEYGMTAYVTEDGLTWTPLSEKTSLEFRNLRAVDGLFIGVNEEGIWRSENLEDWDHLGTVTDANRFLLDAQLFSTPEGVVAIDISGSTHDSSARTIARSMDLVEWEMVQRYTADRPLGLVGDGETFVANVGTGLLRSENGRNWIEIPIDGVDSFFDVIFEDETWVAVGQNQDAGVNRILWSADLDTWNIVDHASEASGGQLLYLNGVWLLYDGYSVWRSTDLTNWSSVEPPQEMPFSDGRFGTYKKKVMGGRFVFLHSDGFFSSPDGETWSFLHWYSYRPHYSNSLYSPSQLRYRDGYYVYPNEEGTDGPGATHIRSLDLTSWEEAPGFQEDVQKPWASIGDIGLAYFNANPDDYRSHNELQITFDGGVNYVGIPENYSVLDILASEDAFYICNSYSINEMSLVDLTVENTEIFYDQTPGPDVPITVEFDLQNIGLVDYTRTGELKVNVVLAPKGYLDGSRSLSLFETILEPPLAVDEALQIRQEVLVPRDLPAGEYHLGVHVDSTDILSELNEVNNFYFSPEVLVDIPEVTLTVNNAIGGSVVSGSTLPQGLAFSSDSESGSVGVLSGDLNLPFNAQLDLIAKPNKNYVFAGWEGYTNHDGSLLNLNLTSDVSLTPIFRPIISVSVFVDGGGSVNTTPLDLTDLTAGETVSLTAVPDEGWTFLKWEGALASSAPSASLNADSSKQIRAVFYRNQMDFEHWKSEMFSVYEQPDPAVSGHREDPDGDGYSNLMEFLLRTNPKDAGDKPVIHVRFGEDTIDYEFETDPRITTYKAVIYSSSDLKKWDSETPIEDETTHHSYQRAGRRICAPTGIEGSTVRFFRLQFDPDN